MIGNRKVCIISDADDKKIVLINDIVFKGVNHAENGKKYLYDILAIKKETSKPQQ